MLQNNLNQYCKVKRTYPCDCMDGKLCKPVAGSFVDECGVDNCKKFN